MTLYEFIKATPDFWPHPDRTIVVDYHDNEYSLDWDLGKGRMVSIGITLGGDIVWATMIDGESCHGSSKNAKSIPQELFDVFKRLGY